MTPNLSPWRRDASADPAATLVLTAAFGLALLWPALLNGGALLFNDSGPYVNGGAVIWEFIGDQLAALAGAGGAPGESAGGAPSDRDIYIRSIAYSAFAWPLHALASAPWGVAVGQAALSAIFVALFLGSDATLRLRALAMAAMATLTPLPLFASFAMPDVFAGLIVLIVCVVLRREGRLGWIEAVVLAGTGGAFAAFHLSHPPLSLAVGAAGAVALLLRRALRAPAALVLFAPPFIALAANLVGSAVAFDEPSVAPKRLPIALARSLADGPARRHVEAACATDPDAYSLCAIIGELPDSVEKILFRDEGFKSLPGPDALERLREEEPVILARAAAAEPLAQLEAFVSNAAKQLWTIGLSDMGWSRLRIEPDGSWEVDLGRDRDRAVWRALEAVHAATAVAALLGIVAFALRDRLSAAPDERGLVLVVAVGLLANAAICGGLSAPADRYGARIVWTLPLLAALLAARRAAPRAPAGNRPRRPAMSAS